MSDLSDLEEARRLLRATEAKEIRVYGGISPMLAVQLSAGWVAIANAAIDGVVWAGNNAETFQTMNGTKA